MSLAPGIARTTTDLVQNTPRTLKRLAANDENREINDLSLGFSGTPSSASNPQTDFDSDSNTIDRAHILKPFSVATNTPPASPKRKAPAKCLLTPRNIQRKTNVFSRTPLFSSPPAKRPRLMSPVSDFSSPAPRTPVTKGPLSMYSSPCDFLLDRLEKEEAAKHELANPFAFLTSPSTSRKRTEVVGIWHGRLKLAEQELSEAGLEEYEIEDWFDAVDDDEADDMNESHNLAFQMLDAEA
ncbi:hypothetical protein CYLTODRAFT_421011 [Cylindrobasidium torrendii FP15055 ss-10]|uniref:Uncharacterized protein n=1 Tax=Cylindrobasidium torrendii FP15055 ss-10 TaxID=1314674 RepID=A0A0D7BFV4_9AGAR|nr:hypothetical protein CYLTODRAFT_421011 [Cylindrobasidium torrendii FP15055 ss-10]